MISDDTGLTQSEQAANRLDSSHTGPVDVDEVSTSHSDDLEYGGSNQKAALISQTSDLGLEDPWVEPGKTDLDHHVDPFAPRDGKTLLWRDINMTAMGRNGAPDRKILSGVWGEVPANKTTAIMGSSGAGKTSLLNVLAGRVSSSSKLRLQTDVRLNNYSVDPTNINVRKLLAFVAQDDSLQVTSTPREAIKFSARLRLPKYIKDHQLDKLTERMLEELGLSKCADTIVGGALIKGISGGERKRTSVGVELVVKPAMVFLDEPTSGLDSFNAVRLCRVLKKVANAGSSVLFTIHQPASEIFAAFDRLILLHQGRVLYQGPVTEVPTFFGDRGFPNPPHYNPADWVMNVAQTVGVDELEKRDFFPSDTREIMDPFQAGQEGRDALGRTLLSFDEELPPDEFPVGQLTQIKLLFLRELVNFRRNTTALVARFSLDLFMGVLIGLIFYQVAKTDYSVPTNIQSSFGALIMVQLANIFAVVLPGLLQFPEERPVFLREYSTNHYTALSYFVSRLTMEVMLTGFQVLVSCIMTKYLVGFQSRFYIYYICIYCTAMAGNALGVFAGSAVEDPKVAIELLPVLFLPQILFAGFFVTPSLIPFWLRWVRHIFPLTFSTRILIVEEFEDRCSTNIFGYNNCELLMENVEAEPDELWENWVIICILFCVFRLMALLVLQMKAKKFY